MTRRQDSIIYGQDTIGNDTSVCDCDIIEWEENYRYNGKNQLTEKKNPSGITEYVYDGNGSLISEKEGEKTTSYQYDLLNRQVKVWISDGREQENLYDGEGLRAGLRENGKGSSFLFYNGEILAECDGDGVPVRRHLSRMGLSYMQTMDDGMYHACYQDEQGSTAYITGDGGAVENSYVYDAFGNVLGRREGIRNDILYRGQKYDQEAGQYYLRARYYNPVIGRFTQEDSYRGDGLNLYAYCGNNPVMYYDPGGHTKVTQPATEPEVPMTAGEGGSGTIKYNEVRTFTAEETNQWFIDNVKPDYKPPYKSGTIVTEIELTENTTFVRVYDNMPDGSGMYGGWVMKPEDIEGLTPLEIQNKFALPNTPKYVCDVELNIGTHIRVGEVNPLDRWGTGGGTQYDLIGQRVGDFKNERILEGE